MFVELRFICASTICTVNYKVSEDGHPRSPIARFRFKFRIKESTMKVGVRDACGRFLRSFDVRVKLPWDSVISLIVQHDMTVAELQSLIEVSSGIPSQLLELSFQSKHALGEELTLRELHVMQGLQFKVTLPSAYGSLILSTIKGSISTAMNEINRFKSDSRNEFAKGIALFISAHKGHHHLLEKLLSLKANPDFRTRSLRTPLHVACAMGNISCVGSLLHFGASYALKDINGQTPLQVAFSCGHREIQRRVQMIQKSKSRQERFAGLTSSWSKSPRFPVSHLARSVSPVIALRELSIQPGPELTVTSFQSSDVERSCRQKIESEGESLDQPSSAEDSEKNLKNDGGSLSNVNVFSPYINRKSRPKTAPPRTPKCTAVRSADTTLCQSSSVIDYETRDDSVPFSRVTSTGVEPAVRSAPDPCRQVFHKHASRPVWKQEKIGQTPLSAHSTKASSVPKTTDRLWVIKNFRERLSVAPRRQAGIERPSTAPLYRQRQPATMEENKLAFEEWLQNKSQGAKDDKMVKRVSVMVDEAFGRNNEVPLCEESNTSKSFRKGISHEEWRKRKNHETKIKSGGGRTIHSKETGCDAFPANNHERLKHCSVSQWFEEKRKEEINQKSWKCKKKKFNRAYHERRTQQAEMAFNKWRLQKEWEEIARLT